MNKKLKTTLSVILSLIFIFSMTSIVFAAELPNGAVLISDSKVIKTDEMKIIAYRGLSACAPENTLSAISLAGRSGCYGCEIDVQPTIDGWVCFSDLTLDAKTSASGVVSLFTTSELSSVVITKGNNIENYPNEKIPTISEAINVCKIYDMKPYLVIKNGSVDEVKTLLSTLKLLGIISSTTIISSNSSILSAAKAEGAKTAYNALAITTVSYSTCKTNGYNGIYASSTTTNDTSVMKTAVANNIEVLCYGINTLASAESFYKNGIKTVMSTSLVQHAPTAEKITYSIFTNISQFLKNIFDFFAKLIRKVIIMITGKAIENI